ncbi:peptide ABC transporter substrate-binding protein [Liquorilactobacillus capillatus]|uniref:Oligopeptide ABC superfamily ATP binding cassette transporter, binding protein n=1 Tax=Liquorilactobacillus capillatus DSM 19910 TaxID=1423731 RepID=A0A0R1M8S4_9LACO|nr:peptide ABC transporter substrate-binding protein [Liquorilactobacillus capillatus]KRL01162.1 oligopeptide ABC superfamily ATP binding cassette transporter, binding protein [Liquorilactobacillus capillatus DSM 19910]
MKKRLLALTGVALTSMVMMAACGRNSSSGKSKQVLTVATNAEMATLSTTKYSDTTSLEALQNSFEGLYRFNTKNKPVLAGASNVSVSQDQKTYTFDLRKTAKWSNGDPVTATDYVYAWQKMVDPATASPNSQRFQPIKNGTQIADGKLPVKDLGIKAIGTYKLQVTLESPISYFSELMTGAPFYPQNKKIVEKYGNDYGTSAAKTVYNGPFVVKDWSGTNLKWAYVRNKNYWDKKDIKLQKVNVQVVKDPSTAGKLYQTDKLDYAMLTTDYIKQYEHTDGYHSKTIPLIGYMSFNVRRKATANVHFRKAIALAFNKNSLVKDILHVGSPLNGIVPKEFAFNSKTSNDYRQDAGNMLTYNLKDARKEWTEAKKELGSNKINIQLLTSDTTDSKQIGEYLQSQLETNLPGLSVSLQSIPLKSRLAATTAHNYDIVYGTWQPDYADPVNFISDGGQYHINDDYNNSNFRNLLDKAATTYATDPVRRWSTLIEAEKQLLQKDAFTAPVYQGGMSYLLKSKVKGLQISPYGTVLFYRNASIK